MSDQDSDWTPSNGEAEEEPEPKEYIGKRKKTSPVWKFCKPIDDQYALCNMCNQKLSYRASVTNLKKHFHKKHPGVNLESSTTFVNQFIKNVCNESDNERSETQRAANSITIDHVSSVCRDNRHVSSASKENRSRYERNSSGSKYATSVNRRRSPERFDYRPKAIDYEESEFELFGRGIVMQLKQLPLVYALELQSEITNLIIQKRIQSLRQNHQTNTEESPVQYTLVYATSDPNVAENGEEMTVVPVEKNGT